MDEYKLALFTRIKCLRQSVSLRTLMVTDAVDSMFSEYDKFQHIIRRVYINILGYKSAMWGSGILEQLGQM